MKKIILKNKKKEIKKIQFLKNIKDGFDGISSNPNYKMLALLIILLINLFYFLSLGILVNLLRNVGIM